MNDTERLDWLEKCEGSALISDDAGHWAVCHTGMQNLPMNPPQDMQTTYFVEKHEWRKSIREAIDAAIQIEAAEAADEAS